MNTMYKLFFILSTFLFSDNLVATGPSYIVADIKPIALNNKGDVLCRTRYIENPTGGHYYQTIEYGICVLSKDTIIYDKIHLLEQESIEDDTDREAQYQYWQSFYNSPYDSKQKYSIEQGYNFKATDMSRYMRNDTLNLKTFKSRYKFDLGKTIQYSLYGGKGVYREKECLEEKEYRSAIDFKL